MPLNIKQATSNDYDVFLELKSLQKVLRIQLEMTWVKGHYNGPDHHFKYQLNKIAHQAAVTFLKNPHPDFTPHHVPLKTPSHTISISHNNSILTSHPRQIILRELHENPIKEKILKDNKWSTSTFNKVNWDTFRLAMSSISRCHQVSICKLTNGLWNTNEQNCRYYGKPNNCPYCSSPETLAHIFTYRSGDRLILWRF
jgi:hypothetical protein